MTQTNCLTCKHADTDTQAQALARRTANVINAYLVNPYASWTPFEHATLDIARCIPETLLNNETRHPVDIAQEVWENHLPARDN